MITVVANGCFAAVTAGHVHLLSEARKLGDRLIVLFNTVESIRRLKPDGRPIIPDGLRVRLLCSLPFVDAAVPFPGDTPEPELERLRPDILVKGAEYEGLWVPGQQYAGSVAFVKMLPGISTTWLLRDANTGRTQK